MQLLVSAVLVHASAELLRLLQVLLAEVVIAVLALVVIVLRLIVLEILEAAEREIVVERAAIFGQRAAFLIVACDPDDFFEVIAVLEVEGSGTSGRAPTSRYEWRKDPKLGPSGIFLLFIIC